MKQLDIPALLWWRLTRQLRLRGRGCRESGAFILGKPQALKAQSFICYDDLDEAALVTGIITFHACGFVKLWDLCQRENLQVLADVHTHPGYWTDQSESDRTHPMIAQPGHIAIILPHYAQKYRCSLRGASTHEYLGDHRWKSSRAKSGPIRLTLL